LETEEKLGIRALFDTVDGIHDAALEAWIQELPQQLINQGALDMTSRVERTQKGYSLEVTMAGFENLVPTHQTISF
jgi:hypothetical protein